jgi:hypothetical protein
LALTAASICWYALSHRSSESEAETKTDKQLNIIHLSAPKKQLLIFYDNAKLTGMLTHG